MAITDGARHDLLVALIYLEAQDPDNEPLTIVVSDLVSSLGGGWQHLRAAHSVTAAAPSAVLLVLQRSIVRDFVGGPVEG